MAAGWLTTIPEQEASPPEGSPGFNHPPSWCGRPARAAAGGRRRVGDGGRRRTRDVETNGPVP